MEREIRSELMRLTKYLKFEKSCLNKPDECYFGGSGKIVEHHLSYIPEIVVHLTTTNHLRLHHLIAEYQELICKKDLELAMLLDELNHFKADVRSVNSEDPAPLIKDIIGDGRKSRPQVIKEIAARGGYTSQHARRLFKRFFEGGVIMQEGKMVRLA